MVEVRPESIATLDRHGETSIQFEVSTVFDIDLVGGGLGGVLLSEQTVDEPWLKDYDAADGGPSRWASRFDVSSWGMFGAYEDGDRIGGAVIAVDTPNLHMLRGRRDLAVLWDLRVSPGSRRSGAGGALFHAAAAWAQERGCSALEVETQQVNVSACRFYQRMGCSLAALDRFAYAELPDETQLIWHLDLDS
jgi:GNAT superfamily N-acetyltransferase